LIKIVNNFKYYPGEPLPIRVPIGSGVFDKDKSLKAALYRDTLQGIGWELLSLLMVIITRKVGEK